MRVQATSFRLASFLAIPPLLCLGATASFAQSQPGSAAPADTPPPATAQPPATPQAQDGATPPGNAGVPPYAPPPGYDTQPAYPPAGYYPPPGYMPPPGYYPPPGYPSPGAYYPPPPSGPPPGHHEHDGFYMRLCMGLGYLHTSDSYQGQTETVSGPGVGMDMAFGAAVARNLLVFGDLSITMASEPTWKYAGTSDTLTNTTLTLLGMGPGALRRMV